jgi:hypothetical protein
MSNWSRINLNGLDLSGHVRAVGFVPESIPGARPGTLKLNGYWETGEADPLFPDGSLKLAKHKRTKASFSMRFEFEPWFYRKITGKRHPRIRRMHPRYPAKWKRLKR